MSVLHWELSVLSRAIAYKNLSGAADNVGISQPQLSRIVAKLEQGLGVSLLDRSSRRNSTWTPAAFRISELYSTSTEALERQLQTLAGQATPRRLAVATLEGLSTIASEYCRQLFERASLEQIELGVYDLHEIEERYFKSAADLIFVPRLPGRKKLRYSSLLGYQALERSGTANRGLWVISPFEQQTHKDAIGRALETPAKGGRVLVSNSLAVRRQWIEDFGGNGLIPSPVRSGNAPNRGLPVYMVASEGLGDSMWAVISSIRARAPSAKS